MIQKEWVDKFEINTGKTFGSLLQQRRKYDFKFLVEDVQKALIETLTRRNIVTSKITEKNEKELKSKYEKVFKEYDKKYGENKLYPFEPFFFKRNSKTLFPGDYVEFRESCVLTREDKYFDFFFALDITLTASSKLDLFFNYHLEKSFDSERKAYGSFLTKISLKYSDILDSNYTGLIDSYTISLLDNDVKTPIKRKRSEFTTMRKVLFCHYLFDEFNVYKKDKTDVAKIIQLLIEKDINPSVIKNSNIYKFLNDILSYKKEVPKKDLIYVRDLFERLGIQVLVSKINKEINKK